MKYRLADIPVMLTSPGGRKQVSTGIRFRLFPILAPLATLYRRTIARKTKVVVVVGSFGKSTTTKSVSAALGLPLHPKFHFNCFTGIALAILRIRPWQKMAVIEVGISDAGQMARYASITRPDVVVVTSIGSEGIKQMKTIETIRYEKSLMVRSLPDSALAVLNGDDPNVLWMAEHTSARVVTYGFGADCDVQAFDYRLDLKTGSRFVCRIGQEEQEVATRQLGRHMMYPALAALTVAESAGLERKAVIARLAELTPAETRLQAVELPGGVVLLSDECKGTLETVDKALDVLSELSGHRRIIVMGDVNEVREQEVEVYGRLGERMAEMADHLVVVGRGLQNYTAGAVRAGMSPDSIHDGGKTPQRVVEILRALLQPGDLLLTKSRKGQRLERVRLMLQGQDVRCQLSLCELQGGCLECPVVGAGWAEGKYRMPRDLQE